MAIKELGQKASELSQDEIEAQQKKDKELAEKFEYSKDAWQQHEEDGKYVRKSDQQRYALKIDDDRRGGRTHMAETGRTEREGVVHPGCYWEGTAEQFQRDFYIPKKDRPKPTPTVKETKR